MILFILFAFSGCYQLSRLSFINDDSNDLITVTSRGDISKSSLVVATLGWLVGRWVGGGGGSIPAMLAAHSNSPEVERTGQRHQTEIAARNWTLEKLQESYV